MTPGLKYRMQRRPDFNAYARQQGLAHELVVAQGDSQIVGLIMISYDCVYFDGCAHELAYTGELKLLPEARSQGLGDRLMAEAIACARRRLGPEAQVITTVSAANPVGLKMNQNLGRRGVIEMKEVLHYETFFFPCWPRFHPSPSGFSLRSAQHDELEQLQAFWQSFAPRRQLARDYAAQPELWPPLEAQDWLTLWRGTELMGLLGVWDQEGLRQIILEDPAWSMRPFLDSRARLRLAHGVHLALKPTARRHLPRLIAAAQDRAFQKGLRLFALALDTGDPLRAFLPRLHSSSQMILLSNVQPRRPYAFQMEIALG